MCIATAGWTEELSAADPRVSFNIPKQRADLALMEFAEQADLTLMVPHGLVENKEANSLIGEYTLQEGIDVLLTGTGLSPTFSDHIVLSISPSQVLVKEGDTMTTKKKAGLLAVFASIFSGGLDAQESQVADQFDEIVVSAQRQFLAEDTSGATNLDIPIEKVPQSITLVTQAFIQSADLRRMDDVAQYTTGATYAGNPAGQGSRVLLRGFQSRKSIDGLTVSTTGFGAAVDPDFSVVDRFEIVKGPSSVVYGAASPGGIINLVTKNARANPGMAAEFEIGSWDYYRVEAQVAGSLDSADRFAAIGVIAYEQGNSFQDVANHDKKVAYVRVDADFTDDLNGFLSLGYDSQENTSFDGVPVFSDGTPADVPRSFYIGSKDAIIDKSTTFANASLDWRLSENWEFGLKMNLRSEDSPATSAPYGFGMQDNGDFTLAGSRLWVSTSDDVNVGVSTVLHLDNLFGTAGSFVSASILDQSKESRFAGSGAMFGGGSTANIFDSAESITALIDSAVYPDTPGFSGGTKLDYLVYSVQGYLQVSEPLALLVGISRSELEATTSSLFAGQTDFDFSGETSLRSAITYEFMSGYTAYVSYSESFEPQFSRDVDGNLLPPLSGEQYELGLKFVPDNSQLLVTGSVFQLDQVNRAEFDQNIDGTDRFRAVGEVRHRGAEFEVIGSATSRLQLTGGVAYLDPVVSKNQGSPELVGEVIPFLPELSASVFADYVVNDSLSLGAGVRYVDSVRTDSTGTTRELPSYTIVDLAANYQLENWQIQLNVHNLFDEHYFVNNYDTLFFGNTVGRPANFSISAKVSFQ